MTPKELGYYFPAEWTKHTSTWLSYPHNQKSWLGELQKMLPYYREFIKALAENEKVNINVDNEQAKQDLEKELEKIDCNMNNVCFHLFVTNDAWLRDNGPAFVVNGKEKAIVNWNFNAWGEKYKYELDNKIPQQIADYLNVKMFSPNIIMEGGSVDFNGKGDVITTKSCLLNKNRNSHLSQQEIEKKLCDNYGVDNVIWLSEGLKGDDTDGHIDDMTRFVNEDTVITMVETDKNDDNYSILQDNLRLLKGARLKNGKQINIIEIQMPNKVEWKGQRLPASYANFYIANEKVIVPLYDRNKDEKAMRVLQDIFSTRQVVGIDATYIIIGLGSFHCLSQQEPEVNDK